MYVHPVRPIDNPCLMKPSISCSTLSGILVTFDRFVNAACCTLLQVAAFLLGVKCPINRKFTIPSWIWICLTQSRQPVMVRKSLKATRPTLNKLTLTRNPPSTCSSSSWKGKNHVVPVVKTLPLFFWAVRNFTTFRVHHRMGNGKNSVKWNINKRRNNWIYTKQNFLTACKGRLEGVWVYSSGKDWWKW